MRSHFLRAKSKGLVYVGRAIESSGGNAAYSVGLTTLFGGVDSRPRSGDIIVVVTGFSGSGNFNPGVVTSGYTELCDIAGDDTYDANLSVSYKISNGTETSLTVYSHDDTVDDYGGVAVVQVWRGVHQTTPIDVTTVTATGANTGRPNVPSITPVTAGAVILGCGLGTSSGAAINLTATGLDPVSAHNKDAIVSGCSGIIAAYTTWTSGAYDMAQFGGGSTSTSASWAAAAVVLRPA